MLPSLPMMNQISMAEILRLSKGNPKRKESRRFRRFIWAMGRPCGQVKAKQNQKEEHYLPHLKTFHSERMKRITAQDLKEGSRVRYRTFDGWKQSNIYKASDLYIWFYGMGVARMRRDTFDNYPDKYQVLDV